ncbi:tyrosine-protein phosphatase [Prescottella agglutinans]|uniref:Protein-tyrosine phosphatase n=1 Tax=Prescottella agglutinans TaxID=1644129 RepID=A0ABT6MHQ1_9NOCA|nr:tyrosine-protein phosphatase [Prescottella agglutinans]MDH6283845.1 protein-tyrosine phosphatase [Prescottella agglutinans]
MKAGSSPLRTRTVRSATAVLIAGGMFLSGNMIASAQDTTTPPTTTPPTTTPDPTTTTPKPPLEIPAELLGSLGSIPGATTTPGPTTTAPPGPQLPGGALGSLGSGSADVHLDPTPRLASVPNFRDVAGNEGGGYEALANRHLKRGVIYRSNALVSASDEDLATLSSLKVTHIYDLRGTDEIANPQTGGADKLPAGADYKNVPIEFGDLMGLAQTLQSPDEGRQFMENTYRAFVTDPAKRAGLKQVLTDIAGSTGPVLLHCSAGKDRTGWIAALLLTISGVQEQTIADDYLLSNQYLADSNAATLGQIRGAFGDQAAANLEPVLNVDKSYLDAGLTQMRADYGGPVAYLADGIGLDQMTIAKLAKKLNF